MKMIGLAVSVLLTLSLPVLASDGTREERVHFQAGAEGATVKGHIKGWEGVDYLLGAQAGQRMTVTLHTDNTGAYFNVLPPKGEEALFVGSSSGNRIDGTLPRAATIASGSTSCVLLPDAASRPTIASRTQLTLGLERDDAVKAMLAMAIKACRKAGKYIGICGQGPSDHPDPARWLLEQCIESMSLNPDTVVETGCSSRTGPRHSGPLPPPA